MQGAPDLYADAGARFLATHLLAKVNRWPEKARNRDPGNHLPGNHLPGNHLPGNHLPGNHLTDRRLLRALEYIAHRFMTPLTLDELAREAGISRFHFTRLFKAKLGLSPHQYVVQLRLDHAKGLLTETDLSVVQIAVACGYAHDGHFAAGFQRRFGVSPSAFRKAVALGPVGQQSRDEIEQHLAAEFMNNLAS